MSHTNNLPRIAAWGLMAAILAVALLLHVVGALLVGLLAYALTSRLVTLLSKRERFRKLLGGQGAVFAGLLVGVLSLAALGASGVALAQVLNGENIKDMMLSLAQVLNEAKRYLPPSMAENIPDSVFELKDAAVAQLRHHSSDLARISTSAAHGLTLAIIAWLAGVMAAVQLTRGASLPVFAAAWHDIWSRFVSAFERVAFAQLKIAAVNAGLTGVFLLVICPWLGWAIPYAKTLVLATFLCGLLPLIGNLMSNALICTLALSVSLNAACAVLVFLVLVHKGEYLLNARIQGHEIGAHAWELLVVLFAFETLFGPAGMVAAPVIYAFVKAELQRAQWLG